MRYFKDTATIWAMREDGMERCVFVDSATNDFKDWVNPKEHNLEALIGNKDFKEITKDELF